MRGFENDESPIPSAHAFLMLIIMLENLSWIPNLILILADPAIAPSYPNPF
jgi:hypothetical protein